MIYPDFEINGNDLPNPTEFKWILPEVRGIDGFGNKRFDPYYSMEIRWDYLTQEEFYSGINRVYLGHFNSGSATSRLPEYYGATYGFKNYSGTIIDRPEVSNYVQNFVKDVKLIIRKIRVE